MKLSPQAWHHRFQTQAKWTKSLRDYLYQQIHIHQSRKILEVGCGSGVILADLQQQTGTDIFGLDIDESFLHMAIRSTPEAAYVQADAHQMPFLSSAFDLCICHFFLLWVTDPLSTIKEMMRITQPGGYICALAEPDYGGRIDFPDELTKIGQDQILSLQKQGANPLIGRQVRSLFARAGLSDIVAGALGGQWELPFNQEEWVSEWEVLEYDLEITSTTETGFQTQKTKDLIAWQTGERILFVPTFFAWGRVPN